MKTYTFDLRSLAAAPQAGRLDVWLQGGSDLATDPDHHVRLRINGVTVAAASWDGARARKLEGALPPGFLRDGANLLELENAGDTAAAYSVVFLDRFAIGYPRRPVG